MVKDYVVLNDEAWVWGPKGDLIVKDGPIIPNEAVKYALRSMERIGKTRICETRFYFYTKYIDKTLYRLITGR